MEITEVRVKLMNDKDEKLQAFCSVTLNDDFVIRDLKIIGGSKGPFVAMPSRKLMDRCPKCHGKNHLRARFCNDCGKKLNPNRADQDQRGRARLHTDIAHPINSRCREQMQQRIIEAFEKELMRSREPGYEAPELDDHDLLDPFMPDTRKETATRARHEEPEREREKVDHKRGKGNSFDAGIFS